jgi:hypothetical protein
MMITTSRVRDHLSALTGRRVFFGHKSVGASLVEAVEGFRAENPDVRLRVVESAAPDALAEPGLAHARVGSNYDPASKIREFSRIVRGGIGDRADVALFKFCFVDVLHDTDVDELFAAYRAAMAELAAAYPRTRFAHVTVPIQGRRKDWRGQVRRLLGRLKPFAADNAARHRFNELLRREYAGRGVLFDLAAAEAVRPNGEACVVEAGGAAVPCLCPEYTHDGGHLNGRGRRVLAERFLAFLAGESGG